MTKNYIHSLIQKCLLTHCAEILDLWSNNLDQSDKFLLFRMTGDLRFTLRKYFDEVVVSTVDGRLNLPPLPMNPIPLDAARREVSILLVGKELFTKFIYSHLGLPPQKWLIAQKRITEVFHRILRANSESTCDSCRLALDGRFQEVKELSASLEKATKEHCQNEDGDCTCRGCV